MVIAGRSRLHPKDKHPAQRGERRPFVLINNSVGSSYWKLSSKQVHLFPDAFNWFCSLTSKRQPSSSVGQRRGGPGLSWLLLQSPSNPHLPATPAIPATTISIHGNAIDSLYDVPATQSTKKIAGGKNKPIQNLYFFAAMLILSLRDEFRSY